MTVAAAARGSSGPYTGTGAGSAIYVYNFPIAAAGHLEVDILAPNGTIAKLTLSPDGVSGDYTVTGVGIGAGGTITLLGNGQSWMTGSSLASGYKLYIFRTVPYTQLANLRGEGGYNPPTNEQALDLLCEADQQLSDLMARSLVLPLVDPAPSPLPSATLRANGFLAFDASGNPIISTSLATVPAGTLATVIDTIAALKALAAPASAVTYVVRGYAAVGDGGGGIFRWNAADSSSDNGGTILQPNAGGVGRWNRMYDGALNVLWFGAKGDNSTDDTTPIQNCFNAAPAAGGHVYFPPKLYKVTARLNLKSELTIVGGGPSNGARIIQYTASTVTLYGTGVQRVRIYGLGVTMSSGASSHGIQFTGASSDCFVQSCEINSATQDTLAHCGGDGIHIDSGSSNIEVNGCVLGSACRNGLYVTGSSYVTSTGCLYTDCYGVNVNIQQSYGCVITGNSVSGSNLEGILIQDSMLIDNRLGNTVTGNMVTSAGEAVGDQAATGSAGIHIYNSKCSVVGNTVTANGGDGILIEKTIHCTITGNFSGSNGQAAVAGSQAGIHLLASGGQVTRYNVVSGNKCVDGTPSTQQIGINETGAGTIGPNLIIGNECTGNATSAVVTTSATTVRFSNMGEVYYHCLGSPSVSLTGNVNDWALPAGEVYLIGSNGAYNITGIAAPAQAQVVVIKLVNVSGQTLTIKHNSVSSSAGNRILNHSTSDLSFPSGAIVELIYDTSSPAWRTFISA